MGLGRVLGLNMMTQACAQPMQLAALGQHNCAPLGHLIENEYSYQFTARRGLANLNRLNHDKRTFSAFPGAMSGDPGRRRRRRYTDVRGRPTVHHWHCPPAGKNSLLSSRALVIIATLDAELQRRYEFKGCDRDRHGHWHGTRIQLGQA